LPLSIDSALIRVLQSYSPFGLELKAERGRLELRWKA